MKPPALVPWLLVALLIGALWALVGLLYAGLFRPSAQPFAFWLLVALPFLVDLVGYRWTSDSQADWARHALALGIGAFLFFFVLTF